jgi:hypothetical protein
LKASNATIREPRDWPRRVKWGYMLLWMYLRVDRYNRTTVGACSLMLKRV